MSGLFPVISRGFSMVDQMAFAQVSGDTNPLHVNAVAARRLLFGEPVVHGIHALLWALDCLTKMEPGFNEIKELKATFSSPIRIDELVTLNWERGSNREAFAMIGSVSGGRIKLSTRWDDKIPSAIPVDDGLPQGKCKELHASDIESACGAVPLVFPRELAAEIFDNLVSRIPTVQFAEILATTRIIGMECPGLHSLYSGLDLAFGGYDGTMKATELSYRVKRWEPRINMIDITVAGPDVVGRLSCFLRPGPAVQASMDEVQGLVTEGEFAGQNALVIGGSRGLGEITSKIIAAGGGNVILTYHADTADAERVVDDISAHGGRVKAVAFDVLEPAFQPLDTDIPFTHVYYFASPKIVPSPHGGFNGRLFNEYCRYYLLGVATVFAGLEGHVNSDFTFYYPSTVFIDENLPEFTDYIAAKTLGETMGTQLAAIFPDARFAVSRLPRLTTDQTQSLMPVNKVDSLPLMLLEVREIHDPKKP